MQNNNNFTQETNALLDQCIGGFDTVKDKKVILTSIVVGLPNDEFHIINKVTDSKIPVPMPHQDYLTFMFLRANCEAILNTGKTVRSERDFVDSNLPDFKGHKDLEDYFYRAGSTEKKSAKPMFVLSNQTTKDDILTIPLFKCKAFHHLVQTNPTLANDIANDQELKTFAKENEVSFVNDKIEDFPGAVNYLLETKKFRTILVEGGVTLTGKYLEDPSLETPIDQVVLSVFRGKTDDAWIGKRFPNIAGLKTKYDLIHTSPVFPCEGGELTIYVFLKKEKK